MVRFKGKLYLLPAPIDEHGLDSIPSEAIRVMHSLEHFIVERARTSRRYISSTKPPRKIETLLIEEMPEDKEFFGNPADRKELLNGAQDWHQYSWG